MKMNYEEFKNTIKENIRYYLPEWYDGAMVIIERILKNNVSLDGLIIRRNDSNITPIIYLNDFYQQYIEKESIEAILKIIAEIQTASDVNYFEPSMFMDFLKIKDKISAKLICKKNNEELLAKRPHTIIADLAVIYYVLFSEQMSVPITSELLSIWEIDCGKIHEIAKANQEKLTPSIFTGMNEMMVKLIARETGDDEEITKQMCGLDSEEKMFVLSNTSGYNGATAILDANIMDYIAERIGKNFYIIPSSVHELIIIPEKVDVELCELEAMVSDVNKQAVMPQDQLSDSVYRYDYAKRELVVVNNECVSK